MVDNDTIVMVTGCDDTGVRYWVGISEERNTAPHCLVFNVFHRAAFFTLDDPMLADAMSIMRANHKVVTRTVEVIGYRRDGTVAELTEFREAVEKQALARLSKTEIEVLGVMSRAIYHRLAGDL